MNFRYRYLVVLQVLLLLLASCGTQRSSQATAPLVVITAPVAGQQVQQGEQVAIQATATDAQGVARVEVGVDGVLLATFENPSPAANVAFPVQQVWTASTPGSHSVMVVVHNTAGVASSPAVVNITVVAASGLAPTTAPTDSAVVGPASTPTWTPIAVSGGSATTSPPPTAEPPPPTSEPPAPSPTTDSSGGSGGQAGRPSAPGPITGFENFGNWRRGDQPNGTFTQSSEQVHGGSYSGKLAYNFPSGGNDFVVFLQTFQLGGQPNRISAWVYGDGKKHYLNVWLKDAKGETWQFTLGQVKHTGWQQMDAWLDPSAGWPAGHIDGPSNGAIDYPIDFRALVLDDVPDSFSGSGTIYLDDLSSAQGSAPQPSPTPTATTKPPSGAPSVSFRADDYTISAGDCTRLRWDVENVREVYLDGEGVVGHGKRKVCPGTTTTYRLRVIRLDGGVEIYEVTITVV